MSSAIPAEFLWLGFSTYKRENYYVETQYDRLLKTEVSNHEVVFISGITGSGKSTLAQAFLCDFIKQDESNHYCYLLNAENRQCYENSLQQLALDMVGCLEFRQSFLRTPKDEQKASVYGIICRGVTRRHCTFVLDNLVEKAFVEEFKDLVTTPRSTFSTKIIVTSQSQFEYPSNDVFSKPLDLSDGFAIDACKATIGKRLGNDFRFENNDSYLGPEGDLDQLIANVNKLPLALSFAGEYLRSVNKLSLELRKPAKCSFRQYTDLFSRVEHIETEHQRHIQQPRLMKTQHTAIWISIQHLVGLSEAGVEVVAGKINLCKVICFLGYIHGDHISQALVLSYLNQINDSAGIEHYCREIIKNFSLLQIEQISDYEGAFLHIHRCVQDVIKCKLWKLLLKKEDEARIREDQLKALSDTWEKSYNIEPRKLENLEYLLTHVNVVLSHLSEEVRRSPSIYKVECTLRVQVARYISEERWDAFYLFYYLKPFIKDNTRSGSLDSYTKQAYLLLADAYLYLNVKKSEEMIRKLEELYPTVCGVENEDWVEAQITLIIAYTAQHQWEKAGNTLKLLDEYDQNKKHQFLKIQEALGRLHYQECKLADAKTIFTEVLNTKTAIGETGRNIAHTEFELGVVNRLQGNYEDAERCLESAYGKVKPLYKTPDLGVAHVLTELARVCFSRQEYRKSEEHYTESLRELKSIEQEYTEKLGDLDIASGFIMLKQYESWSQHGLGEIARVKWEKNREETDWQAAHCYFCKTLALQKEVYTIYHSRPEDMDIAMTLLSMGQLFLGKDLSLSEQYLQESLRIQESLYGYRYLHCNVARTQVALGKLKGLQNKLDDAKAHVQRALDIFREVYPKVQQRKHPDLSEAESVLSDINENMKQRYEAII